MIFTTIPDFKMAPWHLKKGTIQVDGISHQLHTLAKSPTVTMANSKVTPNSLRGSYQQLFGGFISSYFI